MLPAPNPAMAACNLASISSIEDCLERRGWRCWREGEDDPDDIVDDEADADMDVDVEAEFEEAAADEKAGVEADAKIEEEGKGEAPNASSFLAEEDGFETIPNP